LIFDDGIINKGEERFMKARRKNLVLALLTGFVVSVLAVAPLAATPLPAPPLIPPTVSLLSENFELRSLADWNTVAAGDLHILATGGVNNSVGLAVLPDSTASYIYRSEFARVQEGYLTFWFNPHNVSLPEPAQNGWPPDSALNLLRIGSATGDWWPPIVGLYLRKPAGQSYQGFLAWPNASGYFYDYQAGKFNVKNGWQKITVGYKINAWVAVWIDDVLMAQSGDVVHTAPGDFIELGQAGPIVAGSPSGYVIFDDISFQVPRYDDLWVDVYNGNDAADGLTADTALRTLQRAADLAGPGTTVHILPGVYRETVTPAMSGLAGAPIRYVAENGPGTAILRGSTATTAFPWTPLTSNTIGLPPTVNPADIYYTDLSSWGLTESPRFVFDITTNRIRLPVAREPDWYIASEWKQHELWWAADGGSNAATCDPITNANHNCDTASRSLTRLTDITNDSEPAAIEPGNLTSLGDLTGGTIVALDTVQGHYIYRRKITAHNVAAGRVTVDRNCEYNSGSGVPGLGWGSKYYVENKPYLLDNPGEWWYDVATGRLYMWPLNSENPANRKFEILRLDYGFNLRNRSYITLDGLWFESFNASAIYQANQDAHQSYGNTVRNVTIRYAGWGVFVEHTVSAAASRKNITKDFTIEDSEIAYIDNEAVHFLYWWGNNAAADSFTHPGIVNTVIRNNHMHHLGFRSDGDNSTGAAFFFAQDFTFEGNYVHHVAHNGVQFLRSVIQSGRTYGFTADEIKTGRILIKDNIFEKACQLATDCGGLKVWGLPPDGHVFKDILITGNVFRSNFGWAYAAEKRQRWMGGAGSIIQGMGGFGVYMDMSSGVHAYRNVAYNNAYAGYMFSGEWRDGEILYLNNVAANNLHGFAFEGIDDDTHGNVNTQVKNNVLINNEMTGISFNYATQLNNVAIDYNLYYNNGWRATTTSGLLALCGTTSCATQKTIAQVRANTPWEDSGAGGDPAFWSFDLGDHNLFSNARPSFHLTAQSALAIDRGTVSLPASLAGQINNFHLVDARRGAAFDVGRYEGGFTIQAQPTAKAIDPGGTATYQLAVLPADLPYPVTVTVTAASPDIHLSLSSPTLVAGSCITLTATHTGPATTAWYVIEATGANYFKQTAQIRLLVGGARTYLPLVLRGFY